MIVRPTRTALVIGMLVLLASAAVAASVRPGPPAQLGRVSTCPGAVLVDGRLRCGAEVEHALVALCGRPFPAPEVWAGDRISIRVCEAHAPARGGPGWGRMDAGSLQALRVPLALNEAPSEELESLPGIGPALAQRIIGARPLAAPDQLIEVRGIGPRTLERIRGRVVTTPPVIAVRRRSR